MRSTEQFIQKKKEIFFLSMSLGTRRAECERLEATTARRERQLDEAAAMLERDSAKLDAYLRDNDLAAVDAVRTADAAARARSLREQELRHLQAQMLTLRAEIARQKEHLAVCESHREFIVTLRTRAGLPPDAELTPDIAAGVVRRAEEANLLRIQAVQAAQEQRASLAAQLAAAAATWQREVPALEAKTAALTATVTAAASRIEEPLPVDDAAEELRALETAISSTHVRLGLGSSGAGAGEQLAALERELLAAARAVEKLPPEYVTQAERQLEMQRRERMRQERTERTTAVAVAAAARRAKETTKPKQRPQMWRSVLNPDGTISGAGLQTTTTVEVETLESTAKPKQVDIITDFYTNFD